MVSKLVREKLKPIVFRSVGIFRNNIKFEYNALSITIEQQFKPQSSYRNLNTSTNKLGISPELDIHILKQRRKEARNAGYYLYPIINNFDNLTTLSIIDSNIPFTAFADIGRVLPNLNKLELYKVNLVKSPTDIIVSSDISFPPNLKCLKITFTKVVITDLSDPYKYLFNKNNENYSYERFLLPKHSLYFLKHLQYVPSDRLNNNDASHELEEFLEINPGLESLCVEFYNLKMDSGLNSLKFLRTDESVCFNSIANVSSLNSINTLIFNLHTVENTANFSKLCILCNNLVELRLFNFAIIDSQVLIDDFITPVIPNLLKLKILQISGIHNNQSPKIFDFTKFTQIEELILHGFGSISDMKFDSCKSLKRLEFAFSDDDNSDKFMKKLNSYGGWTFKYKDHRFYGIKN
ncbi:hypothetical protein CONCODRAFT_80380 [Conidiobolus coronatus NRRL 28638]|uniref:RNI-like protein n=1 Tax=Conidiobolus coronatus (strain ATCC 28846 / CBS 209.66 / NRRL 28638) TaxID=796925 RepID=A0A137NVG6_CONC2|nr:hypothetical protein CONCODRAFT_80380 [Conidiobolus coronatus NRRL 28638]|eukprot:KXN66825.1 hypothetical protein CONCODRAFT_80380 [Conidiobolus coronatus NRRL 28638]